MFKILIRFISLFIPFKKKRKAFRKWFCNIPCLKVLWLRCCRFFLNEITFPLYENPEVSIIIPVYNQYKFTLDCLYSILKYTKNIEYEIIIADDNSADETRKIEEKVKNIHVIRNEINQGFLLNVENAVQYSRGKYLFLMNNDMLVTNNWLIPLLDIIRTDSNVGIVGGKILNENGTIQQIGFSLNSEAQCSFNHYMEKNAQYSLVPVDFVSGCTMLFSRETWDKLGGFDKQFLPAYYEDTDFNMRVKYELGLKLLIEPKSEIFHIGAVSYTTKASELCEKNKIKFLKKWGKYLTND